MLRLARPPHGEAPRPVLPVKMQRGDVERLLPTIRRAYGLSEACALALLLFIQSTRPADWTDPTADPVCHAAQMSLADRLGVSPRAVRYHEVTLERAGLIAKTTAADGSRGRFAGGQVVQGLSLAPLVALVPQLLALATRDEAERLRVLGLRRQCSAARRVLKVAVERLLERAPKAPLTAELLAFYAALPRRYDGLEAEALDALLAGLDEAVDKAQPPARACHDSSGVPEAGFRLSLQDTTEDHSDFCSGSPAVRSQEEEHLRFERGHKPGYLDTFTPRRLYAAASEDMRLYIDATKGDRPLPRELDLVRAAILILPELGINHSAWDEAVDAMGDLAAALSVIVIDARRFDPIRPIRSPGGALRSFARLAVAGKLNLHGSLIGLLDRARPT